MIPTADGQARMPSVPSTSAREEQGLLLNCKQWDSYFSIPSLDHPSSQNLDIIIYSETLLNST